VEHRYVECAGLFALFERDKRVQLSVSGNGGHVRQIVSRSLMALRGTATPADLVFSSRKGRQLVNYMLKAAPLTGGAHGASVAALAT
jgi:hypothetical protein